MTRRLLGAAMVAGVLAVYALRLDDTAGLVKDDAYYIVLAQALARGQGYALISSPAPILPAFPPGFALSLAPIVAMAPGFPNTVPWLKALSVAAMLGSGWLLFEYLRRERNIPDGRSAAIAILATLAPAFVFVATSTVMSECVFTLALMASAVAVERAARRNGSRSALIVAALATTAAWLIRASGIALVVSGVAYLLWRRGWRAAVAFLIVCGVAYLPWYAYSQTHQASEADRLAHGGDIVRYYQSPLISRPGAPPSESGGLARRVGANLVNVFGRDMGAVVFPAGYRGADESGLEVFHLAGATELRAGSMGLGQGALALSSIVTLVVIAGVVAMGRRRVGVAESHCAVTIAMLLLVSSHSYRYLLPITPFLLAYFLDGVRTLGDRVRAGAGAASFRIAAGCILFFLMVEHGQYVWMKTRGPLPGWIQDGHEIRALTDFINRHVPPGGAAVSTNPALLYLATGHKTVAYVDPDRNWEKWRAAGVRYAVALHTVPQPDLGVGYQVLYRSPRLGLWVLDLNPNAP